MSQVLRIQWQAKSDKVNLSEFIYYFLTIYLFIGLYKVLAVALKLLAAAHGVLFPDQGSDPGPLHWACRVLATEPPGKSTFRVYDQVENSDTNPDPLI